MTCPYGCYYENWYVKCATCGHPKGDHSAIHPHGCQGEYDSDRVHIIKSCFCHHYVAPNLKERKR